MGIKKSVVAAAMAMLSGVGLAQEQPNLALTADGRLVTVPTPPVPATVRSLRQLEDAWYVGSVRGGRPVGNTGAITIATNDRDITARKFNTPEGELVCSVQTNQGRAAAQTTDGVTHFAYENPTKTQQAAGVVSSREGNLRSTWTITHTPVDPRFKSERPEEQGLVFQYPSMAIQPIPDAVRPLLGQQLGVLFSRCAHYLSGPLGKSPEIQMPIPVFGTQIAAPGVDPLCTKIQTVSSGSGRNGILMSITSMSSTCQEYGYLLGRYKMEPNR
jgi:hypothetical protein